MSAVDFSGEQGSMIVTENESATQPVSGGRDDARRSSRYRSRRPGMCRGKNRQIFSAIAERKIAVDMVVQNAGTDGRADVSFTVPSNELKSTLDAVESILSSVGATGVTHDDRVSKVSVVGSNMATQTGVASQMFSSLGQRGRQYSNDYHQ